MHSLDHLLGCVLPLTGRTERPTLTLQAMPVDLHSQTRVIPARVTTRAHRVQSAPLLGPDFSLASRRKIRRGSPLDELPRLAVYRLLVALSLHLGGPTPPEHR